MGGSPREITPKYTLETAHPHRQTPAHGDAGAGAVSHSLAHALALARIFRRQSPSNSASNPTDSPTDRPTDRQSERAAGTAARRRCLSPTTRATNDGRGSSRSCTAALRRGSPSSATAPARASSLLPPARIALRPPSDCRPPPPLRATHAPRAPARNRQSRVRAAAAWTSTPPPRRCASTSPPMR